MVRRFPFWYYYRVTRSKCLVVAIVVAGFLPVLCLAQYPYSVIPTQDSQIFSQFYVYGTGASKSVVPVSEAPPGASFTQALQFQTTVAPATEYADGEYAFGAGLKTTSAINNGDLIVVRFWMRAASSEPVGTRFFIQKPSDPYTKMISSNLLCLPEWTRYEAYCPGLYFSGVMADLGFHLGFGIQAFQIAGLTVMNYGPGVDPTSLGLAEKSYGGREQEAPWRVAAQERIDRFRKANLVVRVTDGRGAPLAGVPVHVKMLRHSFGFGSAITAAGLTGLSADDLKYQEMVERLFNKAVFENDLKWGPWENTSNRARVLQAIQWLNARRIATRGHCLVWPGWSNMPADLQGLTGEALRTRIRNHIMEEAGTPQLASTLVEWDVLNEPYTNHNVMDLLGKQEMGSWFRWAHEADPDAVLYINDYDIVEGAGANTRHQDHYYNAISYLMNELQAPIHGIGLQCHFDEDFTSMERIYEIVDRFAGLGLEIAVTEFDVNSRDEQLQADYLRDVMTVMFSHPDVVSFLMWGFWEGRHWFPDAAMFRRDWTPKPSALVYQDLVLNQWWTDADLLSDQSGVASVRGFKGDYEITVNVDGVAYTRSLRLESDDDLLFRMPPSRASQPEIRRARGPRRPAPADH